MAVRIFTFIRSVPLPDARGDPRLEMSSGKPSRCYLSLSLSLYLEACVDRFVREFLVGIVTLEGACEGEAPPRSDVMSQVTVETSLEHPNSCAYCSYHRDSFDRRVRSRQLSDGKACKTSAAYSMNMDAEVWILSEVVQLRVRSGDTQRWRWRAKLHLQHCGRVEEALASTTPYKGSRRVT